MWSNEMSVDKSYKQEIEYILGRLHKMTDLSYAVEESKSRMWIYLASVCENRDKVENELFDIVQEVYLTFFKLKFYRDRLNVKDMTHSKCVLLCSLANFDRDFECGLIKKAIDETIDYNIDGLFHFRLRALQESWEDIAQVASHLICEAQNDDDVFDIAGFITGSEGKKSQLLLKNGNIYSLTKREDVAVQKVFDEEEYNLLYALLKEKPSEILVENCKLSKSMHATMRHIARIVER